MALITSFNIKLRVVVFVCLELLLPRVKIRPNVHRNYMDSHRDFQLRRQSLVLNKDKHLKIVYTTSVGICQSVKSARFMMYWQMNDWHFMNTLLTH